MLVALKVADTVLILYHCQDLVFEGDSRPMDLLESFEKERGTGNDHAGPDPNPKRARGEVRFCDFFPNRWMRWPQPAFLSRAYLSVRRPRAKA